MTRRAIGKLATLPFVRMPAGMAVAGLAWLASVALIPVLHAIAIPFIGMTTWLVGMLLGLTLRTLMRADTLLLPDFARVLGRAGLLHTLVLVVAPALLVAVFTRDLHLALLTGAVQLLAAALGLASGTGIRVVLFAWVAFPLLGLLSADMHAALLHAVTTSYWAPLLAVLLAVLILHFTLRPVLTVSDRDEDDSPMQAIADGRKPASTASGMPQQRGFIGRKLKPILDGTAQRNLERSIARLHKRPGGAARMGVIRAVLLPHDNLQGIAVNLLVTTLIAALYFTLIHHDDGMDAGFLASYSVLIGMSRFAAVGRGMVKMQPNLADLYLTLAPETHAEFQATIADALLKLVAVTTLNCVVYSVLIAVLLHAGAPAELALTALIVGTGASFGALAAHLVGPASQSGRTLVQIVLLVGAMLVYNLVLWLMHRFGVVAGGLAGIAICLPFGLGAWHYARREYLSRRPCFDVPPE